MRTAIVAIMALIGAGEAFAQADSATACLAGPAADQTSSRASTPLETLATANGAARQHPQPDHFVEARHVYAYAPGAIFELYANPAFVSLILLEPGETLNDVAAGDTSRWMVTESEAETQNEGRAVILLKPHASNLRTNIVIVTDRRTYLIEAISRSGEAYSAEISWCYAAPSTPASGNPQIDQLNFAYRVRTMRGAAPSWRPQLVFDDGRRTWIEMPANIEAGDLPPLFVITPEGAELANYRLIGRRYMVDRLFDVAELRLGVRAPVIVRIEREPVRAPARPRRPGGRR